MELNWLKSGTGTGIRHDGKRRRIAGTAVEPGARLADPYFAIAAGFVVYPVRGLAEVSVHPTAKTGGDRKQRAERLEEIDQLKDQFLPTSSRAAYAAQRHHWHHRVVYEKRTDTSPEILQENLSVVISAGKRLNNLVNDIMDFSRLKNAELQLHQTAPPAFSRGYHPAH